MYACMFNKAKQNRNKNYLTRIKSAKSYWWFDAVKKVTSKLIFIHKHFAIDLKANAALWHEPKSSLRAHLHVVSFAMNVNLFGLLGSFPRTALWNSIFIRSSMPFFLQLCEAINFFCFAIFQYFPPFLCVVIIKITFDDWIARKGFPFHFLQQIMNKQLYGIGFKSIP